MRARPTRWRRDRDEPLQCRMRPGDLVGELALVAAPALGVAVGLGKLYQDRIFAWWIIDFVIAFTAIVKPQKHTWPFAVHFCAVTIFERPVEERTVCGLKTTTFSAVSRQQSTDSAT